MSINLFFNFVNIKKVSECLTHRKGNHFVNLFLHLFFHICMCMCLCVWEHNKAVYPSGGGLCFWKFEKYSSRHNHDFPIPFSLKWLLAPCPINTSIPPPLLFINTMSPGQQHWWLLGKKKKKEFWRLQSLGNTNKRAKRTTRRALGLILLQEPCDFLETLGLRPPDSSSSLLVAI